MRKAFSLLWVIALSACAGGTMQSQSSLPAASGADDRASISADATFQSFSSLVWNVQTGASTNFYAIQDLDYYPNAITVDAGDSITYRIASGSGGDAHTVSFVPKGQPIPPPPAPQNLVPAGGNTIDGTKFVNSGILVGGQSFTLHFPKAGTYPILCLFHEPAMESTVVVQPAGTKYPHTPGYYLSAGAQDEWNDFRAGAASVASFPFAANGNTFAAGIAPGLGHGPPTQATVLRFLNNGNFDDVAKAGSKTVKVGTVLTWVNETTNEPHTVTFAKAGANQLPPLPPDPAINVVPAPGITPIDGTKIVNSGTFIANQKFSVKFVKAGTYLYGCLYHDNSRMTGTITVVP